MANQDPVLRMRAADAVEKASRRHPELLQAHKDRLLHEMADIAQIEELWHVVQMMPRLQLDSVDRNQAVTILERFLGDNSQIVRVNAIQALVELGGQDNSLRPRVLQKLEELSADARPAMRARVRKLRQHLYRNVR